MISKDKQYRTRDGREVRIYAVDGEAPWTVHGAILDGGEWEARCWKADGRAGDSADLIEVKPRIVRQMWVNVYRDASQFTGAYPLKRDADRYAGTDRIACVPITIDCEVGEGL